MSRIGSEDVARLAGVSRSTVSRVFTSGAYVKPETRTKILDAAEKLGYRPNVIARSLTMRSTRLVGIVAGHLENPAHAALVRQIAKGLQDAGFASLLVNAHFNEADRVIRSLMSYQVDALVLTSAVPTAAIAYECSREKTPLVITNRPSDPDQCLAAFGDNLAGAEMIADHLLDQGWSRFGYIAGYDEVPASSERESGFALALARRGYALVGREGGEFGRKGAAEAMHRLMSRNPAPDAVFCANDEMAVAAMDVARFDLGLSIGSDIAIAGYAEGFLSDLRAYDITSVRLNTPEIAAAAIRLVLGSQSGAVPGATSVAITPELVVRSSTLRKAD